MFLIVHYTELLKFFQVFYIKIMNKRDAQEISNRIVAFLREERLKKGISQYKLAKDISMSKSSILYIENFTQHPSLYTTLLIANYLDVDISEIIKKSTLKHD